MDFLEMLLNFPTHCSTKMNTNLLNFKPWTEYSQLLLGYNITKSTPKNLFSLLGWIILKSYIIINQFIE